MNSKFILIACVLVIFVAFTSGTTKTFGACSCKCWNSYCEHPTSSETCDQCAKSISGIDGRTSMDGDFCWIKIGDIGLGTCAEKCLTLFGGCSHYNGYEHYTYGNMCWCKWSQ